MRNTALVIVAIAILALAFSGCGGGGTIPSGSAPGQVSHVRGSTSGDDGVISFGLATGEVVGIKVVDSTTGEPIKGVESYVVTDGDEAGFILWDPTQNYLFRIAMAGEPLSRFIGTIRELWLTTKDHASGYQPMATELIPNWLARYAVKLFFEYRRQCQLNDLGPTLESLGLTALEKGVFIAADRFLDFSTGPVGWAFAGIEFLNDVELSYWQVRYTNEGYGSDQVFEIYDTKWFGGLVILVLPTEPPAYPPEGQGCVVAGQVVNARTGNPIPSVLVHLSPTAGEVSTDAEGGFRFESIHAGAYDVVATKPGFYQANVVQAAVSEEQPETYLTIAMSPDIVSTEYRVVLTWSDAPDDLDLHCWTPYVEGNQYHVFTGLLPGHGGDWGNLEEPPYTGLDTDDTLQYGPETITIAVPYPDKYLISVHNWSARWSHSSSVPIRDSRAQVDIYDQTGLVKRYHVPAGGSGLWWNVCKINGATGEIETANSIDATANNGWDYSTRSPSCDVKHARRQ